MRSIATPHDFPASESLFFTSKLSGLLAVLWTVFPSLVSGSLLWAVTKIFNDYFEYRHSELLIVVLALCTLIMQPARKITTQLALRPLPMILDTLGRWSLLIFVLLMAGFVTRSTVEFHRSELLCWALMTPAGIIIGSLGLQHWMRRLTLDANNQRRVLFAGCNETSLSLATRIKGTPEYCMSVSGFFDDRCSERLGNPSVNILGNLRQLPQYVQRQKIDVIYVALPIRHLQRVVDLLDDLRDTTASIYYLPDLFALDLIQAQTSHVLGVPVVALCETPLYGVRGLSKRLFDLLLASTAIVLTAPLCVAIVAAIRISSPGPAIFKQRRYGLDGREIKVYKFRTMTVTEDGSEIRQASQNDARITPIGRWLRKLSFDELPQLFNVIQGRMSLVGPRPHAVIHNEMYRKLIKGYMIRHKMLPGITGLAQVNGHRGETKEVEQMAERVRYDLEYLRRWSISLDFKILGSTVLRLFRDRKAY